MGQGGHQVPEGSRRRAGRRRLCTAMVLVVLLGACWGGDGDDGASPSDRQQEQPAGRRSGPFGVRLSAGEPMGATGTAAAVAEGDALGDDDVAAVVERLPDFEGEEGDREQFNRPPDTLPRPRVGRTVDEAFGPQEQPPPDTPEDGTLEVLRHQPDGAVAVAPFVSVTFDQPMVPLGTVDQVDDGDVPVRLEPDVEGRWRWIGTRTVRFEPAPGSIDRLPAATEYSVEVPAGTPSASGAELAEAHRWTFTTPAPRVQRVVPGSEVIDTEPVLLAVFDQRVDPEAVLDTVTFTAAGEQRPLRLATEDELEGHDAVRQQAEQALEGRWVAFRPVDPLPGDSEVVIEVGPGTPSAEGPRETEEAFTHRVRTRAPLAVARTACGHDRGCRTGDPFTIEMNNPLDAEAFDPQAIEVNPPMATSVSVFENSIVLQGQTQAQTTYEVTLPASLEDAFGQTLGEAEAVSFEVGEARPFLRGFSTRLVTVDPFADSPQVSVTSAGQEALEVTLHAVEPSDHAEFLRWYGEWDHVDIGGLPWPQVASTAVDVGGDPGQVNETTIDLTPALPEGRGHVVVTVEPTKSFPRDSEEHWSSRPTVAWVQATGIGLDAVADHNRLVAWATDLRDGTPIEGATVRFHGREATATDSQGLASLPLSEPSAILVAEHGGDTAVLSAALGGFWEASALRDTARWAVFDDRGIYRPGEEVRIKGWVRRLTLSSDARIRPVGDGASVDYVARDTFGNELATGSAPLTGTGGFDLTLELPAGAAIGPAMVELSLAGADDIAGGGLAGGGQVHQFLVEEFRRPEFEVATRAESQPPHLLTQPVTVAAEATYFAGGALADAPVTWQVTTRPTTYQPPNRPGYTFGKWMPPWIEGDAVGRGPTGFSAGRASEPCCPPHEEEHHTYESRTDATGSDYLRLDFEGETPDEPITVSANAAVEDVNRQSFASTVDLLVHPSRLYVGLRSTRNFVRRGEPLEIEALVTDIDGDAVAGRDVTMTAARIVETRAGGEVTETEVDPQECTVTSTDEAVSCTFQPGAGGRYEVTATVTDEDGGRNRTELSRWVSGAEAVPDRSVDQGVATIVPAEEEHAPGDTAELLVIAPFAPAHGVVTISRHGIEETRTVDMPEGSAVVELAIAEDDVPGLDVRVDVAGSAPRLRDDGSTSDDLPPRPAFATGALTLPVTATSKTLDVSAVPRDGAVEPGASTTVDVTVEDAGGQPVTGAEVAVVVVDEAVLSLVGHEVPDPVAAIHQPLLHQLRTDHSRRTLQLVDPETFGVEEAPATTIAEAEGDEESAAGANRSTSLDAADDGYAAAPEARLVPSSGGGTSAERIEVRTDFDALAVFEPAVPTGADGTATVEVSLPDNLTRYRVMAVAADSGDRFGSGESTITARLPLMVRPSAPRFVNFGDRFQFPVVLQNQGDEDLDVDVVVETSNLSLTGPSGKRVTVPADERVEVRFPVAAEDAGTARFRVTAVSGDLADSATGELPAYTPTTAEAFATYGVVDDGGAVAQPLVAPDGVIPQFGGLQVDTSSTALQALTDAVVYLADYPYESADAYASRIIALVALRDVFAAFATSGTPSPEELDARIRSDIDALSRLQNDGGGFSTWRRGRPADPYVTVQATHALVAAGAAGYPVDGGVRQRALGYLATIRDHFPPEWPEEARRTARAYALSVRALAGDRDPAAAAALYREGDLPLDALAWLWPVVDDPAIDAAIEDTFADRVTETPSAATFTTDYQEGAQALVLASDRRTDGIILDALISQRPGSDLVPKVVNGLVGNQVKGRWSNVQENGFILLALKRYFDTFEAVTPDFVARAWLGDTHAVEHAHRGRSIDTTRTLVPMSELVDGGDIVLAKDGPGRLYYRLGLRYAPDDLQLDPRDEGFVVERTYEAVEDPDDVRRDDDGTWNVRAGAMVQVTLTMVADSARTNMALVDPLPAGLEIVNTALAASPRPPAEEKEEQPGTAADLPRPGGRSLSSWPDRTWFDHQNARDDRAEAFSAHLPAGTYDYTYVARATTPGTFVTPPARAEEIYAPEVFGRSATDTVEVAAG